MKTIQHTHGTDGSVTDGRDNFLARIRASAVTGMNQTSIQPDADYAYLAMMFIELDRILSEGGELPTAWRAAPGPARDRLLEGKMKTVRHTSAARDRVLHVETEGCAVNIEVGLFDDQDRPVTSVRILPDDVTRGGDGKGQLWELVDESRVVMVGLSSQANQAEQFDRIAARARSLTFISHSLAKARQTIDASDGAPMNDDLDPLAEWAELAEHVRVILGSELERLA